MSFHPITKNFTNTLSKNTQRNYVSCVNNTITRLHVLLNKTSSFYIYFVPTNGIPYILK